MVSKYDGLGSHLRRQTADRIPMTFGEIERVTGVRLPEKSQHSRAWWSNNPGNNVMTKVWLDAGFETAQVDMKAGKVVFVRSDQPVADKQRAFGGMAEEAREFEPGSGEMKRGRSSLFGALKGTFAIEPGYDLTSPMYTDEEWAEIEKEMEEDWDMIGQGMSGKKR
jgi:hypothetical protein